MGPRPQKFQSKGKGGGGWLQKAKTVVTSSVRLGPPDEEIAAAIKTFRAADSLCFLEGLATNEGFGISASFNSVRHRSNGNTLELAPKCVTLRFEPPKSDGWAWCQSALIFGKEMAQELTVKMTNSDARTTNEAASVKLALGQKAKLGAFGLGELAFDGSQELGGSKGTSDTAGRSTEIVGVDKQEYAEFNRDRKGFALSLSSPDRKDLVRLNPELNRLSILAPPIDHVLDLKSVKVTMVMRAVRHEGALDHAFAIREASGCWAPLAKSTNKRIVAELLISKFLEPIHKTATLWPPKD